jgi:hypothetical protein
MPTGFGVERGAQVKSPLLTFLSDQIGGDESLGGGRQAQCMLSEPYFDELT